jgi:hypothetical protein
MVLVIGSDGPLEMLSFASYIDDIVRRSSRKAIQVPQERMTIEVQARRETWNVSPEEFDVAFPSLGKVLLLVLHEHVVE